MCATYRWESQDEDEQIFNVSISADKTAENGVVIKGVFNKYELKGTFSTDDGSITIPNQRVGFDADKGQFLSFVHLDGAAEPSILDDPFILDNSEDGDLFTFEEYAVVGESMEGGYLLDAGFVDYGYMAFIYRTGELVDDSWEDAGTATLFDGGFFTPLPRFNIGQKTPVELVIEKSTEKEGLYRLVSPWDSYFNLELGTYLEFDISDPDMVIIPTQETGFQDSEYGMASVQNFAGMYVAGGFGIDDAIAAMGDKKEMYTCTYDDATKTITMPVNSTFTTFAKDDGYWNVGSNYGATDSYIVMPGKSGIDNIFVSEDDAPAEYYNLQGIRVANPAKGQLVIRRQGDKSSKIVM